MSSEPGATAEGSTGGIDEWYRLLFVVGLLVVLAFISPLWAVRAAGTALALGLIWFIVGFYRPSWIKGKSGMVFYAITVLLIVTSGF